jgi:hypothetical protein
MATVEECRAALVQLSANLAAADGDVRGAAALDRTVSCRITDLDTVFVGRLAAGAITDVTVATGPVPRAQIRLAMAGDDLVALVNGELNFARAWGSGRVRLEAGVRDLLRLRSLL